MGKRISEMSYDELTEHVTESMKELRRKAYRKGYEQGKFDKEMEINYEKVAKVVDEETADREFYESHVNAYKEMAQERRDEIVERAKNDIEDLKREGVAYGKPFTYRENLSGYSAYSRGSGEAYNEEFIVNKSKRTVVVLLRGYYDGHVIKKGIAKCAPDDCFNVYIGKAIALRRALGLEVPDEYLHAPQPTEVRVGDVVRYGTRVATVVKDTAIINVYKETRVSTVGICGGTIIDDSREE